MKINFLNKKEKTIQNTNYIEQNNEKLLEKYFSLEFNLLDTDLNTGIDKKIKEKLKNKIVCYKNKIYKLSDGPFINCINIQENNLKIKETKDKDMIKLLEEYKNMEIKQKENNQISEIKKCLLINIYTNTEGNPFLYKNKYYRVKKSTFWNNSLYYYDLIEKDIIL